MLRLLKILRNIILTLLAIALLLCGAVAVIFNYVLTPKRMTPVIEQLVQEHVNSEVKVGSVDFSLFSTLPKVSVVIDSLRIGQLAQGEADLFSVDRCLVTLTPQSILEKRVIINEILFKKPSFNIYVDSLVRPLAHFKIDTTEVVQSDTTTQFNLGEYRFRLDSVRVDSARIVVNDKRNGFYSSIKNLSVGLKLLTGPKRTMVMSEAGLDGFDVMLKDKSFSSNNSMSINSKVLYKRDSALLRISNTKFNVNGINMTAEGSLQEDEANQCTHIDIKSSLSTPSLVEFLNLVPSHFMNHKDSLSTTGVVDLTLLVNGTYSDTTYPDIKGNIKIDNAKMRYGTNPISLDRVDCDADMLLDLNTPKNSYAKINNLFVNTSGIIDINIKGDVTQILTSPQIDIDFDSDIDFDRIHEIAPLPDGVVVSGRNSNDLHTKFALEDLESGNYGKLFIDGESKFESLKVDIDGSKFLNDSTLTSFFAVDIEQGNVLFGDKVRENNSRTLLSTVNCSGFGFKDRTGFYTSVKDMRLTMGANFDRVTQKVNGVGVNAVMQSTTAGFEGEMNVELGESDITLTITPKKEEQNTKIFAKINTSTISATEAEYNTELSAKQANFELNMERKRKRQWGLDGWMGFRNLNIYSDLYPLNTTLDRSRITINGNKIELKGAKVTMGESNFTATGYITNLMRAIFVDPDSEIEGKLSIKSTILDVNELIEATNKSVLMSTSIDEGEGEDKVTAALDQPISDSMSMMLLVPKNSKFDFDIDIDKIKFSDTYLENVVGLASLNEGVISLDKLTFSTIGAETVSSIRYYNIDQNNSNIFMNIELKGARVERIEELLPQVVQFMPMMKQLEGEVNFEMRAKTNVDKNMNIDFNTLRATSSLGGRDLVLMDKETFDQVAKTLMFKNKERNVIDSVQLYIIANKNNFIVQPFEFSIDRYRMVIGGQQSVTPETFDLDYDYNISILKSPLPFKAGVDIKGRNEKFDHKITKAKLKKSNYAALKTVYDFIKKTIIDEKEVDSSASNESSDDISEIIQFETDTIGDEIDEETEEVNESEVSTN